jgi:hypothetical protein
MREYNRLAYILLKDKMMGAAGIKIAAAEAMWGFNSLFIIKFNGKIESWLREIFLKYWKNI